MSDILDFINGADKLLTRRQVAKVLGVNENTLAVWACTKRHNIPYIKVGRSVRYRLSDINNFLQESSY